MLLGSPLLAGVAGLLVAFCYEPPLARGRHHGRRMTRGIVAVGALAVLAVAPGHPAAASRWLTWRGTALRDTATTADRHPLDGIYVSTNSDVYGYALPCEGKRLTDLHHARSDRIPTRATSLSTERANLLIPHDYAIAVYSGPRMCGHSLEEASLGRRRAPDRCCQPRCAERAHPPSRKSTTAAPALASFGLCTFLGRALQRSPNEPSALHLSRGCRRQQGRLLGSVARATAGRPCGTCADEKRGGRGRRALRVRGCHDRRLEYLLTAASTSTIKAISLRSTRAAAVGY